MKLSLGIRPKIRKENGGYLCDTIYAKKQQRPLVVPKALDAALCATMSKIISNGLTYPIESLRLSHMVKKKMNDKNTHVQTPLTQVIALYRGFSAFIPYTVINSALTYYIMFTALGFFSENMLYTSVFTGLITSLYKAPCSYFFRNIQAKQRPCIRSLYYIFPKAYATLVIEDIPELYLKFSLHNIVRTLFPEVSFVLQSMLVGICSTAVMSPMDIWKNRVLICTELEINMLTNTLLRLVNSMVNTSLFFCSYTFFTTMV